MMPNIIIEKVQIQPVTNKIQKYYIQIHLNNISIQPDHTLILLS